MKLRVCLVIVSCLSAMVATSLAQTARKPTPASTPVPRLIKFSGVARDDSGKPISGTVGILFSLYKDQQGGAPLWMETQNIRSDEAGRYSALLGSASADGVPVELFSSGEAQWLGVQIEGQSERPRVLLVSVPYALKAYEAETLSGRNISDFVLANDKPQSNSAGSTQAKSNSVRTSSPPPPAGPTTFTGSNTTQIVGVTQSGSGVGLSSTSISLAAVAGTISGPTNTAVYGLASNTSAGSNAAGVTGVSNSQLGPGVQGVTSSAKGIGVQGVVNSTSGGIAVQGLNNATTGFSEGVSGQTSSVTTNSAGVGGSENAATGLVFGVAGVAASKTTSAAGVIGVEQSTSGQVFGVSGSTTSITANAAGVNGFEGAATGQVYGVSGGAASKTNFASGVTGFESSTSGQVYGVSGGTNSLTNGAAGVSGYEGATTGQVNGVRGATASTTAGAAGVAGFETGTTGQVYGVSGDTNSSTTNAAGVNGFEGATTGQVFGVAGSTNSTGSGAAGVSGFNGATTGSTIGVTGTSASSAGRGVVGNTTATTGNTIGVQGISASTSGVGVNGTATATTGATIGVFGSTATASGNGVMGTNTNTSGGNGVYGNASSAGGIGVFGTNTAGYAMGGLNNTTKRGVSLAGPSFAIVAYNGSTGLFNVDNSGNGFFAGNLNVTGKLTKGSGSFKIDHPLDPANKYLSHSFVESPDMMNVYDGNVTTDRHGLATVTLPDYFEALNQDFRYQLTVIGKFAQAIVAKKIAANRFVIRTSKPNVEVSWLVTGIRQDAYAKAYRIPVEEDKPPQEQGHYLHPELFGAPQGQAVGYNEPAVMGAEIARAPSSTALPAPPQ